MVLDSHEIYKVMIGQKVMVKHGRAVPYISSVTDTSLEAVLREALILLELRFESFDVDGAGYNFVIFFWRIENHFGLPIHSQDYQP